MKEVTTVCLSIFILGSLGMTSQAFAEDGGSCTSNSIVESVPGEGPTDPIDPTDPASPADPTNPTDPKSPNPGTNGPLSIDYVSSLDFGVQKIMPKGQVYFATTQKCRTVGVADEAKEGPNYVQAIDNHGVEVGRSLRMR